MAMSGKPRNLLMLAPQLPYPPEQGAALRNYNILRYLSRRHAVTLIAFDQRGQGVPEALRLLCKAVVAVPVPRRTSFTRAMHTLLPQPDLAVRLHSGEFADKVRAAAAVEPFDIVQCEALELFPYASLGYGPIVLDEHNAEWRLQQTALRAALHDHRLVAAGYSLLQVQKLRRYERTALRRAAQVVSVSDADRSDLVRLAPKANVTVIPNGVDTALYAPLLNEPEEPATVFFAGKMDFRPNIEGALWLVREVMPMLWQTHPEVKVVLFGMQPTEAVQRLGQDARVTVTGAVPGVDAEKRAMARATVVCVPLLSGGGTRLKFLHGLSMAKAVVSTALGAGGFALEPGRHALIASTPGEFAARIADCLSSPLLRRRLGNAGRRLAEERYAWSHLLPAFDDVYRGIVRG